MQNKIKFSVFLLSLCLNLSAYCQFYVSGNNDSRINYRQIKTKKFHIVYPDYYEKNAQLLASVLDTVVPVIGNSLNTSAPNVPILIHTKSAISNGLSVWAPKRMEFWTTPPPTSYAFPYTWQLAIHEYRHTAQMQAINRGVTKYLGGVFGQCILGGIAGVFVPNWFFEGDAVVAETALAPAGRGQDPEYNMYLKAQVLDKGRYGVDKMLLGSMKDFVADKYNLGYFLVSYGRQKYGKNIWGDCLNHVGTSWWKLSMWGNINNKDAKLDFTTLYKETIDSLEKAWTDQDIDYIHDNEHPTLKQWGEKKNKDYVNYKNPIQINDSTILALKSSAYKVQTLVKITNNKEEKLLSLPFLLHSYFQYRDGHILYSQYSPNIRWQQEATADIIEYDLKTNKLKNITSKKTFFTPIYYLNDSLIAAIQTDSLDNQSLVAITPQTKYSKNKNIWEVNTSSYITIAKSDKNVAYSYPVWDENSSRIYCIQTSPFGKCIICYDINSMQSKKVFEPSYDNIKYLHIYHNRLYFIKDVHSKYQLLSIALDDYSDIQIHTNSRYGIDNFCIYDSTIVLSDYTANGYKIISLPYTSKPFDISQKNEQMYFTTLNREQENFILHDSILNKDTVYKSKKYSKLTHLFNFHSWTPFFLNIDSKDVGLGVSLLSQNLLSTSILELGTKFNIHEKNEFFFKYTYSGLYPKMELNATFRPRDLTRELDSNKVKYIDWNELTLSYDITLPFSWTNRNYRNNINLTLHYSLNELTNTEKQLELVLFNSIGYYAQFSNYAYMADNDLYPRTGHITSIKYIHTLTNPFANIFAATSQIFLPGIARNHSIVLTASFQKNTPDVYYFPNEISFVRGVYNIYPKYFAGLLSQYCFPLIYPDSGVDGVFYLKRVVARPFYNFGYYDKEFYQSYGADIETKVHLFRITIPINLGFRIGYCPTTDNYFATLLFSLDV